MYASLMKQARAAVVACAFFGAGQVWAQLALTDLSATLSASSLPGPFDFEKSVVTTEISPGVFVSVDQWTLKAPVPQVDIHGKITFTGTITNTTGSLVPMAYLAPMLFSADPSVPGSQPTWLLDGSRFDFETAVPNSFYSQWTAPYSSQLSDWVTAGHDPYSEPWPQTDLSLGAGASWPGTLFSIWLDGAVLDGPLDQVLVSFSIADALGAIQFSGNGTAVSFSAGDYTSPSLNIGAPEPGTVALALGALVVVGVQFILNLRKRRQAVAGSR